MSADLVEFQANKTSDERSRRRDCRNNLPGDLLGGVSVRWVDIVVTRTQV